MGKKKVRPPHIDHSVLEMFFSSIEESFREKFFCTPEESDFWLREKVLSKNLENASSEANTFLAQAEIVALRAFEEPSEQKRISMAHKALRISADCADAYLLLAEPHIIDNRSKAEDLFRRGVAAGRRALGDTTIENLEKEFWKDYATRPFMRAVNGLASLLQDFGEGNQAIELWLELLRLNPNDDQNVHLRLVPALVAEKRFEEASFWLDRYKLESASALAYSLALMLFKQRGDTVESRNALHKAMEVSGAAIKELLAVKYTRLVKDMKHSIEEETEAQRYVMFAYIDWEDTEGAIDWVADIVKKSVKMQVQKISLSKTFPGLKSMDSTPNMSRVFGAFSSK